MTQHLIQISEMERQILRHIIQKAQGYSHDIAWKNPQVSALVEKLWPTTYSQVMAERDSTPPQPACSHSETFACGTYCTSYKPAATPPQEPAAHKSLIGLDNAQLSQVQRAVMDCYDKDLYRKLLEDHMRVCPNPPPIIVPRESLIPQADRIQKAAEIRVTREQVQNEIAEYIKGLNDIEASNAAANLSKARMDVETVMCIILKKYNLMDQLA